MTSLKDAIALFQQEISRSSLSARTGANGTLAWEVERVALSLAVKVDPHAPDGASLRVRAAGDGASDDGSGHTITIEFRVRPVPAAESIGTAPEVTVFSATSRLAAPEQNSCSPTDERAIAELTELLGPPGFNSSARAAVFCDAVRNLTGEQAGATVDALSRSAKDTEDGTVRQARHLIRGLVQSGPLKSAEQAAVLLRGLFQGRPLTELVRLVERHWNTSDHW